MGLLHRGCSTWAFCIQDAQSRPLTQRIVKQISITLFLVSSLDILTGGKPGKLLCVNSWGGAGGWASYHGCCPTLLQTTTSIQLTLKYQSGPDYSWMGNNDYIVM